MTAEDSDLSVVVDEDDEFDEVAYLTAHPEVAEAVTKGYIPNAQFHYRLFGRGDRPEGSSDIATRASRSPVAADPVTPVAVVAPFRANIDGIVVSSSGSIFVIGWADDRGDRINHIQVTLEGCRPIEISGVALGRFRRRDTEDALGFEGHHHFGFCALSHELSDNKQSSGSGQSTVIMTFGGGASTRFVVEPRRMSDIGLRDLILGYVSGLEFFGNKAVESFCLFDNYFGDALVRQNRDITLSIVSASTVERFGNFESFGKACEGSIIVCLYGRPEYQFVQNALFSACHNADKYEYIYVSNSPELIETLCKTAHISKQIYGLNVSVVMLPSNAGFGAANNVAAEYASTDRLLIVNPDVFPMNHDWALTHAKIVAELPPEQTKLFGPRLFYADGSLMHAGMYFDIDWGVSVADFEIRRRPMLRVEHYGKGAPADAPEFLGSRPVPAISGAFISVERNWFERLGGFAEDYIFGHYEDADLCLRSIDRDTVPWVHDLPLWHLEGKGSTRSPHHEGASMVNRWLFSKLWHERVSRGLLGRSVPLAR